MRITGLTCGGAARGLAVRAPGQRSVMEVRRLRGVTGAALQARRILTTFMVSIAMPATVSVTG